MVVPVPVVLQKENVKTLPREVFDHVDQLAAPRLVEYWEQDPCPPERDDGDGHGGGAGDGAGRGRRRGRGAADLGVQDRGAVRRRRVRDRHPQRRGLDRRSTPGCAQNNYKIPEGAEPLLRPYVQRGMKFFVAKVDAEEGHVRERAWRCSRRCASTTTRDTLHPARAARPPQLGGHAGSHRPHPRARASATRSPTTRTSPSRRTSTSPRRARDAVRRVLRGALRPDAREEPGRGRHRVRVGRVELRSVPDAAARGRATSRRSAPTCSTSARRRRRPPPQPPRRGPTADLRRRDAPATRWRRRAECRGAARPLRRVLRRRARTAQASKGELDLTVTARPRRARVTEVKTARRRGPRRALLGCLVRPRRGRCFNAPKGGTVKVTFSLRAPRLVEPPPAAPPPRAPRRHQPLRLRDHTAARALRQGRARAGSRLPRGAAIAGGREAYGVPAPGARRQPSGTNNFQARYAIRHPWTGPMECAQPEARRLGRAPAGACRATPQPKPALKVAFAPRGQVISGSTSARRCPSCTSGRRRRRPR